MTTPVSVLGVLGWCWVDSCKPTQFKAPDFLASRECVLGVLGFRTRARTRFFSTSVIEGVRNLYVNPEKPNTPNTPNTDRSNSLNLLGFECVGFVLGWLNMCWVLLGEGGQ